MNDEIDADGGWSGLLRTEGGYFDTHSYPFISFRLIFAFLDDRRWQTDHPSERKYCVLIQLDYLNAFDEVKFIRVLRPYSFTDWNHPLVN